MTKYIVLAVLIIAFLALVITDTHKKIESRDKNNAELLEDEEEAGDIK